MIITEHMIALSRAMAAHARTGYYDGIDDFPAGYFNKAIRVDLTTQTNLILTRDTGMHTSGFLKNPDYDKCWHLSLSFFEPGNRKELLPYDMTKAEAWVKVFFGNLERYIWHEGPTGRLNLPIEAHHYRVMVNEFWHPIIPRLEVYSTDFTAKGWKTFSAVQAERKQLLKALEERVKND